MSAFWGQRRTVEKGERSERGPALVRLARRGTRGQLSRLLD